MQFDRLRRRDFITLLGGSAVAWPLAARAQQGRMKRVGMLVNGAEADPEMQGRISAFRQQFEQLGWSQGRNVGIEYRFAADDEERLNQYVNELVTLNPDAIVAHTTRVAKALQRATRTIPIVFLNVSDPIETGIVASLARPGGNFTGLLLYEDSITGKWLGMLKEIAPRLTRAALVANPAGTPFDYFLRSAMVIAPSLGLEAVPAPVADANDIERTIQVFARQPDGGLVVLPGSTTILNRDLVIALAARHRLPVVYTFRFFVAAGGMMSYGTDIREQNRQAASYVDRIMRGAKPADQPVQAPTKYETVVNLKTARALGFDVPPTLLVRADEVIE
jgi:putative ABC transport system substrate-binding protein